MFGEKIVYKVLNSNSRVIQTNSSRILQQLTFNPGRAENILEEIENMFSKKNAPDFIKLFKYFELVENDKQINLYSQMLSPALLSTKSQKLSKRIILADLMKISMDSNNKSMKRFINTLEQGNDLYIKVMNSELSTESLSEDKKILAQEYIDTLYLLYEQSGASTIDLKMGKKLELSGNIKRDFETIGKRYSKDGLINDLPDQIFKTIVGPYQELFGGIDTIQKMKEYMDERQKESNERHFELAKKKIDLKTGDLIKGIIGDITVFNSIVSDGVRAGEFLGVDSHSDYTNEGKNLAEKIHRTIAGGYGRMFLVIKNDPSKIEYSRTDTYLDIQEQSENTLSEQMVNRNQKEAILKRIDTRSKGNYKEQKIEAFVTRRKGPLWN